MGAGIAQLAAQAGMNTRLHDPIPAALERGVGYIESGVERMQSRGRITAGQAAEIRAHVVPASDLSELSDCEFVIEAAPERLDIKLDIFRALEEVVGAGCVLATNTSSLSISELAAALSNPGRLVGLHFFNPAPVMKLVEVVAGDASTPEAIATARAVGEAMGKHVIAAADVPGFIVNRCNRPYSLEALRLLQSRVATVEQIDSIMRLAGGFRMGPFELMDLIGLDTNHAVAEQLYRQSFGEPRYQPSPIQARMIASGHLGRKAGSGWYEYGDDAPARRADPEPPEPGGGGGQVVRVLGEFAVAADLRARLLGAGFGVEVDPSGSEPWLTLDCAPASRADHSGPRAVLVAGTSLHRVDPTAAGFHVLPPLDDVRLVEITATSRTDPTALERLSALITALGWHPERVRDAPGLVSGRIICQLINEAAFLIQEGNGSPGDVDAGMELGVNHPRGPVSWSEAIGLDHVVAILDGLHDELGEERYRVAPILRAGGAVGAIGLEGAAA